MLSDLREIEIQLRGLKIVNPRAKTSCQLLVAFPRKIADRGRGPEFFLNCPAGVIKRVRLHVSASPRSPLPKIGAARLNSGKHGSSSSEAYLPRSSYSACCLDNTSCLTLMQLLKHCTGDGWHVVTALQRLAKTKAA
ncbi:hypothetical protein G7A66_00955 [Altererythrobacter sp. SALINAS58]|uniref:hypothetical protein n=1 Tax=Alteripontixanthobacter muriae TaxID=2705546 RepID=UPI00157738FE|nr:hypothetical protein [Alteripontixanthobacter muriae]NTZ41679.1 hypothetical protein [Alteripontixanthobacter muriae]